MLFSLPGIALVSAAIWAPIPDGLVPVALAGTVLFLLMFGAVAVLVKSDRILLFVGGIVERVVGWASKRFNRGWNATAQGFLDRRNEVVEALGKRWWKALIAAVLNWMLDYLVLVVALIAVGSEPRASLVLVAFAGSAVLGMIPLTPGGLGFGRSSRKGSYQVGIRYGRCVDWSKRFPHDTKIKSSGAGCSFAQPQAPVPCRGASRVSSARLFDAAA